MYSYRPGFVNTCVKLLPAAFDPVGAEFQLSACPSLLVLVWPATMKRQVTESPTSTVVR